MKRVIVVGGGIAGLATAYYLEKQSAAEGLPVDLTVLEAGSHWGGKIITTRREGFIVEGGPDTFLATKPWGVALCRELGLEPRLHGTNPKQRATYVLHGGKLRPLPDGLTMMIPTRFGPMARTSLLSWPQKARMGLDFFLPAKDGEDEESLGSFVSRRLGRAAYEHLIEPLMSGIYAGDGDRLSLQATFPYLRELEREHGGLVKGALHMRRKMARNGKSAPGSRSAFLTPTTGLAEIVEALVKRLTVRGVTLRTGAPVQAVHPEGPGYRVELETGESLRTDAVILAAPAFAAADMIEEMDAELAGHLRQIPYVSTATISLAYREAVLPRPLDGYGYVIPRREGRRALACTWTSTKFPHRAPEGFALLRVFAGRAGEEDDLPTDKAGLIDLAREELRETLGIHAEPLFAEVFFWEKAMPQYNLGHPRRLERIDSALERFPGLALAGNGYRGIGIPDCIHSGERAARSVVEQLTSVGAAEQ